jgi:hypothetical protein
MIWRSDWTDLLWKRRGSDREANHREVLASTGRRNQSRHGISAVVRNSNFLPREELLNFLRRLRRWLTIMAGSDSLLFAAAGSSRVAGLDVFAVFWQSESRKPWIGSNAGLEFLRTEETVRPNCSISPQSWESWRWSRLVVSF